MGPDTFWWFHVAGFDHLTLHRASARCVVRHVILRQQDFALRETKRALPVIDREDVRDVLLDFPVNPRSGFRVRDRQQQRRLFPAITRYRFEVVTHTVGHEVLLGYPIFVGL